MRGILMKKRPPAVDALKKTSKGLLMPSESDAPFEASAWEAAGELTPDRLVPLARVPKGTAVEEASLDDRFRTVPAEERAKLRRLRRAVEEPLSGVRVYKVGDEVERAVYIVGQSKDGQWAGLKTSVVET
jgi:hypothetical protein